MPRKKTRDDLPPRKPLVYRDPLPNAEIIRPYHVKSICGFSASTAFRLEKLQKFPTRIKLTGGAVGWRRADINAWLAERQQAA